MTTPTIPRVKLPTSINELPEQRYNHWILAGTPGNEPYPCTCRYSPCRWEKCSDRQRTEGLALPEGCCGRSNARLAEPGFVTAPKRAESPVEGSGYPDVPSGDPNPASDELRAAREVLACDCVTPWDPPAPVLLIAEGKSGPIRGSTALAAKVADVRGEADKALSVLGRRRTVEWKDGRHVLLPPQPGARGKTRPCWHAKLDDGSLAVLDTPDETGSGIHCPECHRNFASAGAWGLHRARGRYGLGECKDPAAVLCIKAVDVAPSRVDPTGRHVASRVERVTYGAPMFKRTMGDVWAVDQLAPWGVGGPRMTDGEASALWTRAQERLRGARCAGCIRARRGRPGAVDGHTESGPWEFGCGHNRHGA